VVWVRISELWGRWGLVGWRVERGTGRVRKERWGKKEGGKEQCRKENGGKERNE
jgi:hypothetical protein